MHASSDKTVSVVEAARIVFRTPSPTGDQIRRVLLQMRAGTIEVRHRAGDPLRWTTTERALAGFLAEQSLQAQHDRWRGESAEPPPVKSAAAAKTTAVDDLYRGIWRDYFLEIFLCKRRTHRSRAFRRAVIVGQVATLALLAVMIMACVDLSIQFTPAEHRAVERWIAENTERYEIVQWYPTQPAADGSGQVVRAEYRYFEGKQSPVTTDRRFLVAGDTVQELFSSDD